MTDMIDLAAARIVNAVDPRDWPQTARITAVSFDRSKTRIEFTKKDGPPDVTVADYRRDPRNRWPNQPNGGPPGDNFQYTIWLFLPINGVWVGSAFVQMWFGRDGSGGRGADADVPSVFHEHWYYGTGWHPMEEHGPIRPGEEIGFMVTSGNARQGARDVVEERSNVVLFKAGDDSVIEFPETLTPAAPDELPIDPRLPPPASGTVTLATLHADLQELIALIKATSGR
jgi:hypothetical protein